MQWLVQQGSDTSVGSALAKDGQLTLDSNKSTLAKWLQDRPYLLIILAVATVVGCCFCSQILLRFSKQCNLSLNRYYIRKRFEKQKMMTNTINQTRQMRASQNRQRRLLEERGGEDLQSNNVPAVTENETIIEEEDPEN